MPKFEQLFSRVDEALAEGDTWRAKELLRGNIATRDYDPELYKRYGELLLQLGEKMEAGKYLFLANGSGEQTEDAISLYLARRRRAPALQLYRDFPVAAQFESLEDYPARVMEELSSRGLTKLPGRPLQERPRTEPSVTSDKLWLIGCSLVVFVLGVLVFTGGWTIAKAILGAL